jgi:pyruvate formate lyase activating enzyme
MITVDDILERYNRQKSFYQNGGITLSGGEPLIHQKFCLELAKKCYEKKISLALDTSGANFTRINRVFFMKIIKYKPL